MIFYSVIGPDGREVLVHTKEKAQAINKEFQKIDVPTHSAGLQDFIQRLMDAAHAANAVQAKPEVVINTPPPVMAPVAQPSYTQQSIAIEDAWDKLPLTQKLHFASLAMEDARAAFGVEGAKAAA